MLQPDHAATLHGVIEKRVAGIQTDLEGLLTALQTGFCRVEQLAAVSGHLAVFTVNQIKQQAVLRLEAAGVAWTTGRKVPQ